MKVEFLTQTRESKGRITMFPMQFMRPLQMCVTALSLLCAAKTVAEPSDLSMSVRVIKRDSPVIVCENIGNCVSLEVTIRNNSSKLRKITPLSKALLYARLDVRLINENKTLRRFGGWRPISEYPQELSADLKPQKQVQKIFPLKQFGYHRIRAKGTYSIEIKYVADEKVTLTKLVKINVIDFPKESIVQSVEIPYADSWKINFQGNNTFIRAIQLKSRTFLYLMEYYKDKLNQAAWLAEIPNESTFIAAGEVGTRKKIYIAFPHSKTGLTYLTINSIDGTVESRRKTEHPLRNWTDNTGKNTVEARLVELKQGKVQLKKANGETISLPLNKLSKEDQEYVKATFPETLPQKQ